ncbi:disintegrin and metalloproteinase domain-containing protein 5-like [Dama dama]|uniref:disintegrin and metalloproteinase domain-containing protein 5-like n=1 Tax=Dama dama TaxID=30532 RepID=UPI002A363A67|nr:disintegrin and metalloproteinase domain-containing protein 5-like [Dama dama]
MSYDNTEICRCSGDVCTMSPEALQSGGVKDFSTCSLDDFKYFAAYSGIECLHKILPDEPVYKKRKMCGNGILETGEQCDCGTAKDCTHPDCCDARTCLKKKDKVCGSGACCTTDCKIKPVNTLCRKAVDECDFEEFCNGNQPICVPDTYARDGELCESGDAYCYKGRCRSVNRQCSRVLGAGSRGAPYSCYDEINARADRYGNCGRGICGFSQSMCGKLVCAWPYKTLVSRTNLSVIYTHVRDEICASGFLNAEKLPRDTFTTVQEPEDRDETFVEDGSICGPEMYCVNFSCVELKYRMDKTACDNGIHCASKGICNNFNSCHCLPGFAPPNCKPLPGEFGSINDGHTHKTGKSFLKERSLGHPKRRLQLVFYISIPVFIIAAALIIKQDKIRELCYKGELESERSASEESSTDSRSLPSVSNSH